MFLADLGYIDILPSLAALKFVNGIKQYATALAFERVFKNWRFSIVIFLFFGLNILIPLGPVGKFLGSRETCHCN